MVAFWLMSPLVDVSATLPAPSELTTAAMVINASELRVTAPDAAVITLFTVRVPPTPLAEIVIFPVPTVVTPVPARSTKRLPASLLRTILPAPTANVCETLITVTPAEAATALMIMSPLPTLVACNCVVLIQGRLTPSVAVAVRLADFNTSLLTPSATLFSWVIFPLAE